MVNQQNGVGALGLQKALGRGSYHTAWEWLHKLCRAMVRSDDRLSGLVEMDETFIGGERAGKSGWGAEGKTLVLIAAEDVGSGISYSPFAHRRCHAARASCCRTSEKMVARRTSREQSATNISPIISTNLRSDLTVEPHIHAASCFTDSLNRPYKSNQSQLKTSYTISSRNLSKLYSQDIFYVQHIVI